MNELPKTRRPADRSDARPPPSDSRIQARLRNKALHYLGRYASTTHRLKQVLIRFAARKLEMVPEDRLLPAIAATIEECQRLGYVDDQQFALSKIRSRRAQGHSRAALTHKLMQSGINSEIISELMARPPSDTGHHDPQAIELAACIISARRKRIGPYSRRFPIQAHEQQKQLGKLARAGFSHEHARRVLSLTCPQEAEDLLSEVTEAGEC